MILEERVEAAVEYLRDSAKQYGEICGLVELRAHNIKIYRSLAFLEASGTVGEREAQGWTNSRVREAVEEHSNAVAEKMEIMTKRKAAELTIEVWRSQNATKRQGVNI